MAITASEARKNLFPLIEKVNDDRTPIEITSRRGDAVLLSRDDYEALEETAHLLRVPANARRPRACAAVVLGCRCRLRDRAGRHR